MIVYAIRHKPSGNFLPAGRNRGFTHDVPIAGCIPRLFMKEFSARAALRWWLEGAWKSQIRQRGLDDFVEDLICQPIPARRADEMEVVELILTESKNEKPS